MKRLQAPGLVPAPRRTSRARDAEGAAGALQAGTNRQPPAKEHPLPNPLERRPQVGLTAGLSGRRVIRALFSVLLCAFFQALCMPYLPA